MDQDAGGVGPGFVRDEELDRQYRVARQSLSIHTMLRDRYERLALLLDLLLLAASVVFAATTFASDAVLTLMGGSADRVRVLLGLASLVVFFVSVAGLRLDWRGRAALHREAERSLAALVQRFRAARGPGDTWGALLRDELQRAYTEVSTGIVPIPSNKFVSLKARHLRKVQLSKLADETDGAPVWILRFRLYCSSLFRGWSAAGKAAGGRHDDATQ